MTTDTAERSSSRPNVLALPSATTAQLILLLTAILSGGAYIGISLHDWLLANSYVGAARACDGGAPPQADPPAGYQQCFWPTEIRRGLFALGAALVLIVVLVAILLLAQILIRRRRPGVEMTHYFEESRAYLAELKDSCGVSADTMILVGPSGQRDAFTYGAFGRYRIQLPRGLAVRWRTRALFEPVLLHELAHISHRDVKWGWFARASWYAVTPVLIVSLIVPAVQHDWSYFWSYTWRAVLLAVVTQLLIRGYLRARETDADLRTAQILGDVSDITAAISRNTSALGKRSGLLAFHPTASKRVNSITDPASTVRVGLVDGFTAALLATLAGGIVLDIAQNLLEGFSNGSSAAEIVSIGVSNAILGFAVGGGLLRSLTVSRVAGQSPSAAGPALGVGLGVAVGLLATLAQTGIGTFDGSARPWEIAITAGGGIASTAYAAAIARLWSFTVPLAPRPRPSWLAYCTLATGIFWVVGWIASRLSDLFDAHSSTDIWHTLRVGYDDALLLIPSWTLLVIILAMGFLIGWVLLLRPRYSSPGWLLDSGEEVIWEGFHRRTKVVGTLIGVVSASGAIAMIAVEESETLGLGLFYALVGTSLLTGICGSLAASGLTPRLGGAPAVPAAIVSCGLSLGLAVAASTVLHLPLDIHRLSSIALPGITLSAAASVFCGPLAARAVTLVARTR
jgi:Zn-dependent protease with chaperone function